MYFSAGVFVPLFKCFLSLCDVSPFSHSLSSVKVLDTLEQWSWTELQYKNRTELDLEENMHLVWPSSKKKAHTV